MIQPEFDPKYWDTDKPPLLIQGFDLQVTSDTTPIIEDRKNFVTRVNRGVVVYLDYIAATFAQIANGLNEIDFNASQITCSAGGQELLVDEPAERYDYSIDLGEAKEQKIPVRINGGQTIQSVLFLPDLVSNAPTVPVLVAQLQAYYSTKQHQEFVRKYSKFGNGLGLKRRSYRLAIPISSPIGEYNLTGVIPKNQGRVIGFSFMYEGFLPGNSFINLKIDDLGIIENVVALRYSRLSQRDPFINWYELNPGSTFDLSLRGDQVTVSVTNLWLTLYFGN